MTPNEGRRNDAEQLTEQIVQMVSELPDRTSPDDWPEAMLVTATELRAIVADALSPAGRRPPESAEWQPIETAPSSTQVWAWDDERGSNPAMCVDGVWWITYDDSEIHPTHWMPLPAPPSAESAREAVRQPAAEEQTTLHRELLKRGLKRSAGHDTRDAS